MESPVPSKRRRQAIASDNSKNIFDTIEEVFGKCMFSSVEKCRKVRTWLQRHIRDHGSYRGVILRMVKDAIEYHDRNHLHTSIFSRGFARDADLVCQSSNALIIAASCCQKYNLQNRDFIKQLLLKVFYCEGNLDRFMSFLDPLVFPFEVDPLLYHYNQQVHYGHISNKHLETLEYFLQQGVDVDINIQYTEFLFHDSPVRSQSVTYNRRIPLVDIPISLCRGSTPLLLACQSVSSAAVLLLLRHGADPLRVDTSTSLIGLQYQHPICVITTKLNASVFWRTHNQHLSFSIRQQFMEKQQEQDRELQLIMTYFSRVLPRLPVEILPESDASSFPETRISDRDIFLLHNHYRYLVPDERLKSAPELCHLCRCTIRSALRDNKNLPCGIEQLPLPRFIKEYLDLLHD